MHTGAMKFNKGDILVPRDAQFPEGALVVDGYDEAGRLLAHPLGGGFQYVCPADSVGKFRVADEGERERALFRRAAFSLMDSEEHFSGWTNGQRWNGWAKPHFELAEAQRLMTWLSKQNVHLNRPDGDLPPAAEREGFCAETDAFVTMSQDGEEELWEGRAIAITDGSSIKVYPIGAGCWCWDCLPQEQGGEPV